MRSVEVLRSGVGPPVVLVHGDVLSARAAWAAQEELAYRFALRLVNRRGFGGSPPTQGQDFLVDADDVAEALEDGAHLVGHSYGGVAALLAAARHPERVRSLAVIEPAVFSLLPDGPQRENARIFTERYEELVSRCYSPESFLQEYLVLVGTPPQSVPPALPATLPPALRRALVTQMRGKRPWEARIPVETLARAEFPRLVVSGGHNELFEATCSALADAISADRAVLPWSGHAAQALGAPFNDALTHMWEREAALSHR
ncbi:alpha/beta hydrolase [Streptomyces monashensis]|uniref:alpha/beta fold hydrolase n=1 Tax=Streptomyces monashensis TaxID=1678012 RepID=UPI0033D4925C